MKKHCIEMVYRVTETLQNGSERTFKKSVYVAADYPAKFVRSKSIEALKEQHYYNIEFIEAKERSFLWLG